MRINVKDYSKGEIIKFVREWSELTQAEFGKRIGRTRDSIKAYEAGKINYGIDTLLKIAEEFDVEIIISKEKGHK